MLFSEKPEDIFRCFCSGVAVEMRSVGIMRCLDRDIETKVWKRVHTDLVSIVKELQDGEDAGSDEQTHLTPDVTCEEGKGKRKQKLLLLVFIKKVNTETSDSTLRPLCPFKVRAEADFIY